MCLYQLSTNFNQLKEYISSIEVQEMTSSVAMLWIVNYRMLYVCL